MLLGWIVMNFISLHQKHIIYWNIISINFVAGTMSMALSRNFPDCQRTDGTTPVLLFLPPRWDLTNYRVSQKSVLIEQNQNQNWVLWESILPWPWHGKAWSGLILVWNDQKINFQTQGVPVTCNWASALCLQQNSESVSFLGPPVYSLWRSSGFYGNREGS